MSMSEFSWKEILGQISARTQLSSDQTFWAMNQIMSGVATDAQIAAYAMGLRVKGENATEIEGMVKAILANANKVTLTAPALDIVGTGGDGAHTVNVSTMAALVAAGAGVPILKHGNRAISSKSGTADVLEALGVAITMPPELVASCVAEAGIAFCFAPAHHPGFRYAGPVRKELGVPTIFNFLGPLCNPGQPPAALIGCADLRLAPVLAQVQCDRGFTAIVVRSDDGLDELSTSGTSQVWDVTTDTVRHIEFDPSVLGLVPASLEQLRGAEATFNAQVVMAILEGRTDGNFAAIRDVVALNAAAGLVAFDAIGSDHRFGAPAESLTKRIARALPVAYQSIDTGSARSVLTVLMSVSQRFAMSAL
jgi:anthranilate phosphoribosyltransferase